MAKEKLPFELDRPNASTPVANASAIDLNNQPLDQSIGGRDAKVNTNSTSIEGKVNTLISVVQTLIQNVVWWGGVPYNVPQQLLSELQLLRIGDTSSTTALCGQAVCGQAICGTN